VSRARGDRGQVGGIEVLPFGVLIFVVGALLVTNAWGVVDARVAAEAAAREAVRTYVEAPNATTAEIRARRAAADTMVAHGRRAELLSVSIERAGGAPFGRCVPVTVAVRYPVPAVVLPWIGGYGHAFDVHAHHTERIDPFRSGLGGEGPC